MGGAENQQTQVASDCRKAKRSLLSHTHAIARENLHQAKMRQKRLRNHTSDVGDLVYIESRFINKKGQSKKLQKPWIGPFFVTGKLSPVLYRIKNWWKERVVHHDRLKICSDPNMANQTSAYNNDRCEIQDSNAFRRNSEASNVLTSDVKVNSRERRHLQIMTCRNQEYLSIMARMLISVNMFQ